MAGHVAQTGEILHLDDAYAPAAGAPLPHQPVLRPAGRATARSRCWWCPCGRRRARPSACSSSSTASAMASRRFASPRRPSSARRIPYPERFMSLAASLASQAAVALQNSRLLEEHPGAVRGLRPAPRSPRSSRAIPPPPATRSASPTSRWRWPPPSTAPTTGRFATSGSPPTRCRRSATPRCSTTSARSGVREEVLVKAKKLYPSHLELIRQRVELIKRGVELRLARAEARCPAPRRPRAAGRACGRVGRRARGRSCASWTST